MSVSESYEKWRYRLLPDRMIGELLTKPWIDNAIPVMFLAIALMAFGLLIGDFFNMGSISIILRQMGEISFIVMGMTVVILAGGIDLSVGAVFALANFVCLYMLNYLQLPLAVVIPSVLAVGALCGLVNGVLIGYFRLRAFLTTLATLIILRAIVDILTYTYGNDVVMFMLESDVWDLFAIGSVFGIPFNFVVAMVAAVLLHVVMTRMRFGWHVNAVGGSRRSAYNAGINVRRTICMTYVLSGVFAAIAGIFYAARLNSASAETGVGLEITVLTAAVLGGNSLGGGRGSIAKALIGTLIVIILMSSLLRLEMPSGYNTLVLAVVLLVAVATDVRWMKNRHKLLSRVYVSPVFFAAPPPVSTDPEDGTPYALNDRLAEAEAIGLDQVDGAEDVAFDSDDNLYAGSRHGDVVRFLAPDYKVREVYAHIGGQPLGLHFDHEGSLYVCISGMGLYKITRDRTVVRLADETNRTPFSIIDDSRMRFADDMDFGPDGRVYFSEATIRYDVADWTTDALEGRGNGRILCYDPKTGQTRTVLPKRMFPNGICMTGDGESLLFAESWVGRISRYWFDGPRKGKVEVVVDDLPGYPDNIRRSSDGHFWVAMVGMRTPALDLAMRMPSFRRRMAQRVAFEEWIYPNINTGGVIKMTVDGQVLESLWDRVGRAHPMVTSMREHKGYLYIGGVYNNRLGRLRLPDADPDFYDRDLYYPRAKS